MCGCIDNNQVLPITDGYRHLEVGKKGWFGLQWEW